MPSTRILLAILQDYLVHDPKLVTVWPWYLNHDHVRVQCLALPYALLRRSNRVVAKFLFSLMVGVARVACVEGSALGNGLRVLVLASQLL